MPNSQGVYTEDVRDTNVHSYPDTSSVEGYAANKGGAIVKVVNSLDQSVTVTVFGSTFDDADMTEETENDSSTSGVSVAAGETAILSVDTPWTYLRAEASAGTAPTTGSLKVVFQSGR